MSPFYRTSILLFGNFIIFPKCVLQYAYKTMVYMMWIWEKNNFSQNTLLGGIIFGQFFTKTL